MDIELDVYDSNCGEGFNDCYYCDYYFDGECNKKYHDDYEEEC